MNKFPVGQQVRGYYMDARLHEKKSIEGLVALDKQYGKIVVREDKSWLPLDKVNACRSIGPDIAQLYKENARNIVNTLDLSKLNEDNVVNLIEEIAETITDTVGNEDVGDEAATDAIKDALLANADPEDVEKAVEGLLTENRLVEATADQVVGLLKNQKRLVSMYDRVATDASAWGSIVGPADQFYSSPVDRKKIDGIVYALKGQARTDELKKVLNSFTDYIQRAPTTSQISRTTTGSNSQAYARAMAQKPDPWKTSRIARR